MKGWQKLPATSWSKARTPLVWPKENVKSPAWVQVSAQLGAEAALCTVGRGRPRSFHSPRNCENGFQNGAFSKTPQPPFFFCGNGINGSFLKWEVTGQNRHSQYVYYVCKRHILKCFFFFLPNHFDEQEPMPAICSGRQGDVNVDSEMQPCIAASDQFATSVFCLHVPVTANLRAENIKNRLCLSQWQNTEAGKTNIKSLL